MTKKLNKLEKLGRALRRESKMLCFACAGKGVRKADDGTEYGCPFCAGNGFRRILKVQDGIKIANLQTEVLNLQQSQRSLLRHLNSQPAAILRDDIVRVLIQQMDPIDVEEVGKFEDR